ncbi:uncharacterized protein V1518DRAFT_370311 [Limtongia smithiae]|uniref:uncharacterized protein n=1 Tax=Limtongia smithiae TaxID=1125753 RepID=UPI0034CD8A40
MFETLRQKLARAAYSAAAESDTYLPALTRTTSDAASINKPAVHRIETSFNVFKTINKIREHQFSAYDLQYALLFFVGVFCFFVAEEPALIVKLVLAVLLAAGLLMPVTSQIVFPLLPVFGWLSLFTACRFIPTEWRPPIWVSVLPSLETIMYGGNLSEILATRTSSVLDVLAWLPYGIMHYGAPFVCAFLLFVFGSPGTLPVFARSFGYMNLIGVTIQLMFPTSPPWYEVKYGLVAANYEMHGSPGGLARIDQLLGLQLYSNAFGASPLVFGAFPSLHSGFAVMESLFLSHIFPKLQPLFYSYVLWIWWSTMYLTHHYFIDLMGGAILATTAFLIARWNYLPGLQKGKRLRWQYEYIELSDYDTLSRRRAAKGTNSRDRNIVYQDLTASDSLLTPH